MYFFLLKTIVPGQLSLVVAEATDQYIVILIFIQITDRELNRSRKIGYDIVFRVFLSIE